MMKIGGKEAKSLNKLGKFVCFLFVTAFFVSILNPNARALDISVSTPENPIIEISLSAAQLNLNLTPNPNTPTFGTADLTVTAGTNNLTGYSLSMQVANPTLTRTTELESHPLNTPTIPSLAVRQEGYTESSFTRNHWGYKLSSDTNYLAIPESLALSSSSEPTNGNPTTITFASKVDMSLPAGSYSTDINFVAVSNAPIPTLQDINTWKGSLTAGQTILARDDRDGQYYHVGKLADNRIWMLDNLALDLTNSTVLNGMSSLNTNASNTTLGYLKNGGGTENNQYATAGVANWTSSYSYSAPLVNMASKNVVPSNAPTNGAGYNKVGGYYNYCAASAGSYCYGNGTSEGTPSGNATEDICPKNWRIPTSNTGEYGALANAIYGSTDLTNDATQIANFRNALSLPLSGSFYDGLASSQGSGGGFWSSTIYNNYRMYFLYVGTSSVIPSDGRYRNYGSSVRCLVKNPDITISFNSNGGSGHMSDQTLGEFGGNLKSNTLTRSGYTFAGWSTSRYGSVNYTDGATYTGSSTTLYAQWTKANTFDNVFKNNGVWAMPVQGIDYYTLQNMSPDICSEISTGEYGQLVDYRDGTIYNVGKLDDGRCWILDNLELDLTNPDVQSMLNSEFTNAQDESIYALINGTGNLGDSHPNSSPSETEYNSYSDPFIHTTYKDTIPNRAPSGSHGNNKSGIYYTFCAASAGSYCDGYLYNDPGYPSGDAEEDICPRGWRMPTEGEYYDLYRNSENFKTFRSNLSLPLSG